MVFRLIEAMGGEMPDATALCLYAGLVTDTGRFQYEATTPETLGWPRGCGSTRSITRSWSRRCTRTTWSPT